MLKLSNFHRLVPQSRSNFSQGTCTRNIHEMATISAYLTSSNRLQQYDESRERQILYPWHSMQSVRRLQPLPCLEWPNIEIFSTVSLAPSITNANRFSKWRQIICKFRIIANTHVTDNSIQFNLADQMLIMHSMTYATWRHGLSDC